MKIFGNHLIRLKQQIVTGEKEILIHSRPEINVAKNEKRKDNGEGTPEDKRQKAEKSDPESQCTRFGMTHE